MSENTAENPFPDFPSLDVEPSSLRVQEDWSGGAWSGTTDRLVQLQNEVHKSLARLYEQQVKKLPDTAEGRESAEVLMQSLRVRVRATGRSGKMTRLGSMEAIFAETDPADIDVLQVSNSAESRSGYVSLAFEKARKADSLGVTLTVSGYDRSWVSGTADILKSEVKKGVPRWAWLRHGFVSFLLSLIVAGGITGVLSATVLNPQVTFWVSVPLIVLFIAAFLAIALHAGIKRVLPAFEMLAPGESNAGKRVVAGVILATSLVLSLIGVAQGIAAG